jgi:hypothetical protein
MSFMDEASPMEGGEDGACAAAFAPLMLRPMPRLCALTRGLTPAERPLPQKLHPIRAMRCWRMSPLCGPSRFH